MCHVTSTKRWNSSKQDSNMKNCWQKHEDRNHSSRSRHLSTAVMAAGDASPWQQRMRWSCCLRNYGSDHGRTRSLNNKCSSCSRSTNQRTTLRERLEINRWKPLLNSRSRLGDTAVANALVVWSLQRWRIRWQQSSLYPGISNLSTIITSQL